MSDKSLLNRCDIIHNLAGITTITRPRQAPCHGSALLTCVIFCIRETSRSPWQAVSLLWRRGPLQLHRNPCRLGQCNEFLSNRIERLHLDSGTTRSCCCWPVWDYVPERWFGSISRILIGRTASSESDGKEAAGRRFRYCTT